MRPLRAVLNRPPGGFLPASGCAARRGAFWPERMRLGVAATSPPNTTRSQRREHAAYPAGTLLEGRFNREAAQCWSCNSRHGINDEDMMLIESPFH